MLGVSSTEAESWIGLVDGAAKDASGDASAQDPSERAELAPWRDGTGLEAKFVVVSAAATANCTGGFSESAASADAEATTLAAALGFWMRVKL